MGRLRKLLQRAADRVLVGPRPEVPAPAPPSARWTEPVMGAPSPPRAPAPSASDDSPLEVESPLPGSVLLDVREPGEYAGGVAVGALLVPMDLVPHSLDQLPRGVPLTVYCAAGVRSFGVATWLREQGFGGAVSLIGGLSALRLDGVPVAVPPGPTPGSRVYLPAALVDGVYAGACEGEVIAQEGDEVRVRVMDDHGFWHERRVPAPR